MAHTEESRKRAYEKMKQRRDLWFSINGPCDICGSWDRLELDHKDPTQKVHHTVWSWSEDRMMEELNKCHALCYGCHKIKTGKEHRERFSKTEFKHGTEEGYRHRGCRCELCRNYRRRARKDRYMRLGT